MSSLRVKWLVESLGSIQNLGDVTKFEFKISGHAKRIVGVFVSSNHSAIQSNDDNAYTEVELCLNINNGAQNILKKPFHLCQINSKYFKPVKLCYLNEPLIAGQDVSGYIKCIRITVEDPPAYVIPVKIYIKYLSE
jgi:hypothetical protein